MKILFTTWALLLLLACNNTSQKNLPVKQDNLLQKECIKNIMQMDDSLGTIRNHACEKISLSKTIKNYIKGLENLNFKNCPEKFTRAFDNHRQAWEKMIPVSDNFPDLRGEMHDLFDIIEKSDEAENFKIRLKAIWDTWAEVETAMK